MIPYYIGLTVLSISAGFAYGMTVGFAVLGVGMIIQAVVTGAVRMLRRSKV